MKKSKKIFGIIAVLIIIAIVAINVNLSVQKSYLSDISLSNIEALAGESDGGSSCSIEWYVSIAGQVFKQTCKADCASGQKAECKTGSCKCT